LEPVKDDPLPVRRPPSGAMYQTIVGELLLFSRAGGIKHELPRLDVFSDDPFAVRRERNCAARAHEDRGRAVRLPDIDRIVVPAALAFFVKQYPLPIPGQVYGASPVEPGQVVIAFLALPVRQ